MKVLVTGGAGYIGSVTTEGLVDAGHDVVVYDNLLYGHRQAVHPKAVFQEGDLADRTRLRQVFETHSPQAVMHFAAHSVVPMSMRDPLPFVRENVGNALNLLDVSSYWQWVVQGAIIILAVAFYWKQK